MVGVEEGAWRRQVASRSSLAAPMPSRGWLACVRFVACFRRLPIARCPPASPRRHFGQRGELFQYRFVARHRVLSGFTSLVLAHELKVGGRVGGGGPNG